MLRGSAREIQELTGHQNLATAQRYMHLTPATLEATVRLLDQPGNVPAVGDILETVQRRITPKQQRFVTEHLVDLSAT